MFIKILRFLEKQSKTWLMAIAIGSVFILTIIDFSTGTTITFSFFYLIPTSMVAWVIGRKEGIFLSIMSGLLVTVVNDSILGANAFPGIVIWNLAVRLGTFLLFAVMLSEVRNLLEKEKTLARTDFLTGALNRRAFFETADLEIRRVKRSARPFTILYIDLDGFKVINDKHGHDVGDEVLKSVTHALLHNLRPFDAVGRVGGDEFAVLLPETNEIMIQSIAPRIRKVLLKTMESSGHDITFSIGALTFLQTPEDVDSLLKQADEIMYQVKNSGKNAIMYAISKGSEKLFAK